MPCRRGFMLVYWRFWPRVILLPMFQSRQGRSGPEFIARLVELEQFVMASPAGTFDNYEDGFGDCSKHDGAVGWVERNKV